MEAAPGEGEDSRTIEVSQYTARPPHSVSLSPPHMPGQRGHLLGPQRSKGDKRHAAVPVSLVLRRAGRVHEGGHWVLQWDNGTCAELIVRQFVRAGSDLAQH